MHPGKNSALSTVNDAFQIITPLPPSNPLEEVYKFSRSYFYYMCGSRKFCKRSKSATLGSNSATLTTFFFFFLGEGIQIPLKADHHQPTSQSHLNDVSLACRCWPNIECWLCSFGNFENFRGSRPVLPRNPIYFCDFSGGGGGGGASCLLIRTCTVCI